MSMWILIALTIITIVVINYALWCRCWLKEQPWAQRFFSWIEPVEIALYKKSETLAWARWRQFVGYLIAILAFVGTIDVTPLVYLLPERLSWIGPLLPLLISLSGHIAEFLRNRTTLPVEVVALPEDAPMPLKDAAEAVVLVKEEAVAAIKEAKAEGRV